VRPRVPARLRPSCGSPAMPISIPAMARIRGPIGVAALALALLCGCGHGHSATGANWVVFASDRDGRWDVYAVHPNGTGLIRVTARREEMAPLLASSPRAEKLAIVNSAGTTVVDANGKRTTRPGGDMYATPDVSEKGEVTLASGERTSVSPDGMHEAFLDAHHGLWIRAINGRAHKVAPAALTSRRKPAGIHDVASTTCPARRRQAGWFRFPRVETIPRRRRCLSEFLGTGR